MSERSKRQTFFLILILGALDTIAPFSIDMYLPAFPRIANDLHTNISSVALSVSTYFLGFALGQILYGPLLDRFGRKPPLYAGLSLYIIATIACITSGTVQALLIMRFFQAICGCVTSVAAIAMVRDFFPPDKSAQIISLLILILGASPLLAPSVGSLVVTAFGWHYVFILLAAIAFVVLLVVIFFLPEGQMPDTSVSLQPRHIIQGFKAVLINPKFYIYSLAGTFSFAGLFVYVAGSPAIFMGTFHVSPKVYGGIFAFLSIGMIGGSQLNHLFVRRFTSEAIFKAAIIVQVLAALLYCIGVLSAWYGLTGNIFFLFIIITCAGISYPNAASVALAPFSKNAGTASALLGFIQIGIGGIISSFAGLLHMKGSLPTAITIAVSSIVAFLFLLIGKNKVTEMPTGFSFTQSETIVCD